MAKVYLGPVKLNLNNFFVDIALEKTELGYRFRVTHCSKFVEKGFLEGLSGNGFDLDTLCADFGLRLKECLIELAKEVNHEHEEKAERQEM